MKPLSNGNEDIVKAAISASKQAAELKDAAIAKLLEQRNQIDVDLAALGYQIALNPTSKIIAETVGAASAAPPDGASVTRFAPYAGGADFASISAEIKRRAEIVAREQNVIYDTAVDRVIAADRALKLAYGSCA